MAQLALIADDLTGALDAGAPFLRHGLRAVLPFDGRIDRAAADVVLITTASREGDAPPAAAAAHRAASAVREAGISRVYKKIDSTLRGHPGVELKAILDVFGGRAVVAPAFPAQGRTTRNGVQLLDGRPVPGFGGDLRAALGPAAPACDVFDADTDADLAAIARLAAERGYHVWCGTAGLAGQVAGALGLTGAAGRAMLPPPATRVLVVAGSLQQTTIAQVARLRAMSWCHVELPIDRPAASDGVAAKLVATMQREGRAILSFEHQGLTAARVGQLAASADAVDRLLRALVDVVRRVPLTPDLGLVITGGETAWRVGQALAARAIEAAGEAEPGTALGVLHLPKLSLRLATKSGAFGDRDALHRAARAVQQA
jgi:uncharacterized protein YgbK (DUF1537 family)